jgi:ribosomal protein S18 acetylase RimI-like enzyme
MPSLCFQVSYGLKLNREISHCAAHGFERKKRERKMNRPQPQIRDISASDCLTAYDLTRGIYASTDMMCQPFFEKYPNFASFASEVNEYRTTAGAVFLVAEVSQSLVGYITVKPNPAAKLSHTASLNMGVSESVRGQSVGRQLLSAAVTRLETDKLIEILYLHVRADNSPAVKLYESAQFETIAVLTRDTKIDGRYYDGLLMRRFIDSTNVKRQHRSVKYAANPLETAILADPESVGVLPASTYNHVNHRSRQDGGESSRLI